MTNVEQRGWTRYTLVSPSKRSHSVSLGNFSLPWLYFWAITSLAVTCFYTSFEHTEQYLPTSAEIRFKSEFFTHFGKPVAGYWCIIIIITYSCPDSRRVQLSYLRDPKAGQCVCSSEFCLEGIKDTKAGAWHSSWKGSELKRQYKGKRSYYEILGYNIET